MNRVFLDANVLFSAAYMEKAGLLRLWRLHGVKLLTSDYAAKEAAANLPESVQRDRLVKLLETVEITPYTPLLPVLPAAVTLPEKDVPILQAAISAHATVLLTGDVTHFGRYFRKKVCGVRVLPPGDFLLDVGS
jgi:uncharacterized protein